MTTTVAMPQLGESVVEGTIGKWLVQEGERVERDQPVVEVLTDKADSEVPSPVSGVVLKLLAREDEVVRVGAGLCVIDETATGGKTPAQPEPRAPAAPAQAESPAAAAQSPAQPAAKTSETAASPASNGPAAMATANASPSQRKHMREHGLDAAREPSALAPRAPVHEAPAATVPGPASRKGAFQVPTYIERPGDKLVPFSRRRRIIADHMVYSKLT